jgi:hypothetical protein
MTSHHANDEIIFPNRIMGNYFIAQPLKGSWIPELSCIITLGYLDLKSVHRLSYKVVRAPTSTIGFALARNESDGLVPEKAI